MEPGTEVGVTAFPEKWSLAPEERATEWSPRNPGPLLLSSVHEVTRSSEAPTLLGLSHLIYKMGLITHLPYKMVRKMNEID